MENHLVCCARCERGFSAACTCTWSLQCVGKPGRRCYRGRTKARPTFSPSTSGWRTRMQLSVSSLHNLTAFWDSSLGCFLGWKLCNWPEITKSWAVKEPLNNNYLISLLTVTTLCPAAWRGAAGTRRCWLPFGVALRAWCWVLCCTACTARILFSACFRAFHGILCLHNYSFDVELCKETWYHSELPMKTRN